jgi:excisionase family DNA binding protein
MDIVQGQWLTLKEASDFLGVHFTTLRSWADKGEIEVFRTPGGHRRFSSADLRRFLENRVDRSASDNHEVVITNAIQHVHRELARLPREKMPWHYHLTDESLVVARRNRGQQLFALAFSFVMKPAQRERILEEGRRLGFEYGAEAHSNKVNLVEAGRAVRFFRNQLVQAVRAVESPDVLDADDLRIQQQLDLFLDEVLYAVLEGYEKSPTA